MRRLTLPFLFAHLVATIAGAELPRDESWWPKASPLPQPAGKVIRVSTVDKLYKVTRGLEEGTTVLRWEIIDPLAIGKSGEVTFTCRVR